MEIVSLRASRRGQLEAEAWAEPEVELGAEARAKCWAGEVNEQVGRKPCDFAAHVWGSGCQVLRKMLCSLSLFAVVAAKTQ